MIAAIVEQHALEAALLWHLRDAAVGYPHYSLRDLGNLDARVEAHLDGLRIAEDGGWEICKAALADAEAGEVFAAGLLAIERGDLEGIAHVLDVAGGSAELSRGLVSALGWAPFDKVSAILPGLLDPACPPALHYLGIAACAVHRHDPGEPLSSAIAGDDPRLRRRAVDAAGELGRVDLLRAIREELGSEGEELRFAAAWSGALLGDPAATPVLWEIARAAGPRSAAALSMAVRRADLKTAAAWIEALAGSDEGRRTALLGAGALGDPAHVPRILELMEDPALARVAAESFSLITGADIEQDKLRGPRPADLPETPSDDPDDEDVALDPDENLPWPDVDRVRAHWSRVSPKVPPHARYFLGRPITAAWLEQVLREERQRRRAAAAIELALLAPGAPLFEVRAPGFRQGPALRRRR
jgi:uncharacterized protein (TIGR02270 family)